MEDEKIVELYFARDERAVTETMNSYGCKLYRLACRFLKDRRDAEECVNDTYSRAWDTIPPVRPDSLFAYLGAICRNTAHDIVKRDTAQKRSVTLVELTAELSECIPDSSGSDSEYGSQLSELINEYLYTLSKDKRGVFVGRYWYGDSIAEISGKTGFSESKVKTMLHRIRKGLKNFLMKKGEFI